MKVAVIGAGTSGMMCAIFARTQGADVTVFERLDRVGKKLLSTGNGRCNITNKNVLQRDKNGILCHYHGEDTAFAKDILSSFDDKALLEFFKNLGVLFRCENDKYYPYSETASTILDILRFYCEKIGVKTVINSKIEKIEKCKNGFIINKEFFDKVVIACGGNSSPHLGTDGNGYDLLSSFGHTRTKVSPAITQVKTDNKFTKQLKGIKCNVNLEIFENNVSLRKEFGQILFADYGLSGPPVFQLSSYISKPASDISFHIDFLPELTFDNTVDNLVKIKSNPFKNGLTAQDFLLPILNKKVGQVIVKYCDIPLSKSVENFTIRDIKRIASALKKFEIKIHDTKGFQNAQVTLGGIKTTQFDSKTLESKIVKGLYACGEVLDITGDCGGYNLQWAFSSGVAVGKAVAK